MPEKNEKQLEPVNYEMNGIQTQGENYFPIKYTVW